ncbi:hypothetical protein RMSM_06217 [Rhodopirellula maiorica SM1]|uniref:Uncharacterized protein n=1 Tax=Rhodopirellula maiorica SM1 TaxID=1265738 RepID=M5RN94_9BACT|nr:hypothetical protein RMSM_06217 [Rhodopirellula maiorica SM1]
MPPRQTPLAADIRQGMDEFSLRKRSLRCLQIRSQFKFDFSPIWLY